MTEIYLQLWCTFIQFFTKTTYIFIYVDVYSYPYNLGNDGNRDVEMPNFLPCFRNWKKLKLSQISKKNFCSRLSIKNKFHWKRKGGDSSNQIYFQYRILDKTMFTISQNFDR